MAIDWVRGFEDGLEDMEVLFVKQEITHRFADRK